MKTYKFSDYLIDQFRNGFQGWDDNWPDAEEKWYSELWDDELIEYFMNYIYERGFDIELQKNHKEIAIKFIHSLL